MSVEQIEQQIQSLPDAELVRLVELDRRLAEFEANPAIAVPFEPNYFENLKRQLVNERAP